VLPIMLSVMVSKWVADAVGGPTGVYAQWIALRRYPWLSHAEYRDKGQSALSVMRTVDELVVLRDGTHTLHELGERGQAWRKDPC
jgi:chloride channel 3/4/5